MFHCCCRRDQKACFRIPTLTSRFKTQRSGHPTTDHPGAGILQRHPFSSLTRARSGQPSSPGAVVLGDAVDSPLRELHHLSRGLRGERLTRWITTKRMSIRHRWKQGHLGCDGRLAVCECRAVWGRGSNGVEGEESA